MNANSSDLIIASPYLTIAAVPSWLGRLGRLGEHARRSGGLAGEKSILIVRDICSVFFRKRHPSSCVVRN